MVRVFKFGGASVKNADSIKNVSKILSNNSKGPLVVIVSAIDKTTNALEQLFTHYWNENRTNYISTLKEIKDFHLNITAELLPKGNETLTKELTQIFNFLDEKINEENKSKKSFHYDAIVSSGELLSTKIIHHYLKEVGLTSKWIDARNYIITDNKFQEANVNWDLTSQYINCIPSFFDEFDVIVSQGFIGSSTDKSTTTLGREGSDFSAAIFAYCLNAESVTIWKDVPGMLNADPKYFKNTVLLEKISFREAIELSYYGASVIHPKTVKPLQNKNIPLYVKSFLNQNFSGTSIQESSSDDSRIPSYIFKFDQLLFTISPLDFSFLVEENLGDIFMRLSRLNVKINLMQNSALSFSILVDKDKIDPEILRSEFKDKYLVKYNTGLELITIRHYDNRTIQEVTKNKRIIVQQRTRSTARFVVKTINTH